MGGGRAAEEVVGGGVRRFGGLEGREDGERKGLRNVRAWSKHGKGCIRLTDWRKEGGEGREGFCSVSAWEKDV